MSAALRHGTKWFEYENTYPQDVTMSVEGGYKSADIQTHRSCKKFDEGSFTHRIVKTDNP